MSAVQPSLLCGFLVSVVLRKLGRSVRGPHRSPGSRVPGLILRSAPHLTTRRRRRIEWASALDHVAAELRTGSSLPIAISTCTDFEDFRRSLAAGASLEDSLERLSATAATDAAEAGDRRLAVGTLIAVASVGGSGGLALERTAETIRERHEMTSERRAQSAQARLSAGVLSALPAVFAVWSVGTDSRVRAFLLHSELGAACGVGGALLNLSGWLWMKRLAGATD